MPTDQETDPDESQPPFFMPGLLFFHASKQNPWHGHGVPGTAAEELLQAGGLGLQRGEGLFGFKNGYEIAPKYETACLHPDLPVQLSVCPSPFVPG